MSDTCSAENRVLFHEWENDTIFPFFLYMEKGKIYA